MNERQIVPGSISAIAKSTGKSIAELFTRAEVVTIVDISGSMSSRDSTGGKSRYEVACQELASIQANMPGKVAVIAFSDKPQFHPGGVPFFQGGGTDLTTALKYAKIADIPGIKIIVISDGQPDNPETALSMARTYKNQVSVIYVGPESFPLGREFLQRLAAATGGQAVTASCAKDLLGTMQTLLLKA